MIMSLHGRLPTGAPFVLAATHTAHFVISVGSVISTAFGAFVVVYFLDTHGRCLLYVSQFIDG
jgi:hypothetical protein